MLYPSLTPSALTNTDPADLMNVRNSQALIVSNDAIGGRDTGRKLSLYQSTKQMFRNRSMGDNGFIGTYNTDPSTMWYFSVVFDQSHDTVNDIDTVYDVKIVYYAKLSGPVQNVNES